MNIDTETDTKIVSDADADSLKHWNSATLNHLNTDTLTRWNWHTDTFTHRQEWNINIHKDIDPANKFSEGYGMITLVNLYRVSDTCTFIFLFWEMLFPT
jgi:hypothetical protein